jgi:hypothetical protein
MNTLSPVLLFSVCTFQVYSPYQRNWIGVLNSNPIDYLDEFPSPKPNPSTIRENNVLGPLFDADVPMSVHGFELDPEETANMVKIWPAGTSSAKEASITLGEGITIKHLSDALSVLVHQSARDAARSS